MRATWENACCHVGRVARTEIAVRIVVSGSVVYRRAPTLFVPFPSTPPTSHPHRLALSPPKPRNLETPRRKSCKLLPARQSRGYRATESTVRYQLMGNRGDASSLPRKHTINAAQNTSRPISATMNRRMRLHAHRFLHSSWFALCRNIFHLF